MNKTDKLHYVIYAAIYKYDPHHAYEEATKAVNRLIKAGIIKGKQSK